MANFHTMTPTRRWVILIVFHLDDDTKIQIFNHKCYQVPDDEKDLHVIEKNDICTAFFFWTLEVIICPNSTLVHSKLKQKMNPCSRKPLPPPLAQWWWPMTSMTMTMTTTLLQVTSMIRPRKVAQILFCFSTPLFSWHSFSTCCKDFLCFILKSSLFD